ncbi:MAG: phosphatidylcholine and lysophosphatidylcholine phospholipase, partial [Marteilia pararefringens]
MCIVGYLPPVCDPRNNHLLVDGGYVDLVPATDLVQAGCNKVIAVIVNSSSIGLYRGNYGSFISAITAFLYRWLPFHNNNLPTYFSLISHLSFISSTLALKSLKEYDNRIHFLSPNVQMYNTYDFKMFQVICDRGTTCAREFLETMNCLDCLGGASNSCTRCNNSSND